MTTLHSFCFAISKHVHSYTKIDIINKWSRDQFYCKKKKFATTAIFSFQTPIVFTGNKSRWQLRSLQALVNNNMHSYHIYKAATACNILIIPNILVQVYVALQKHRTYNSVLEHIVPNTLIGGCFNNNYYNLCSSAKWHVCVQWECLAG